MTHTYIEVPVSPAAYAEIETTLNNAGYVHATDDGVIRMEGLSLVVGAVDPGSKITLPADRKGRVYIAGPMTGYLDLNFPAFNALAVLLRAQGLRVENPAEHGIVEGAEWGDYLRSDVGQMATCEKVYLLPGWEKSNGAKLEVYVASALGISFVTVDGAVRPQDDTARADSAAYADHAAWWFSTGREKQFDLTTENQSAASWCEATKRCRSASGEAVGWQTIDTVKKHERGALWLCSPDLVDADFCPAGVVDGHWQDDEGWVAAVWNSHMGAWSRRVIEPTHWMVPFGPSAAATPQPAASVASGGEAVEKMRARKDAAYLERNQVVAALARCYPSGVSRTAIEGWSEDWHGCVYIDLPTGQASWHFHDSQAYLFADLPPYAGQWDGHDTPEKYRRLAATAQLQPRTQAEPDGGV